MGGCGNRRKGLVWHRAVGAASLAVLGAGLATTAVEVGGPVAKLAAGNQSIQYLIDELDAVLAPAPAPRSQPAHRPARPPVPAGHPPAPPPGSTVATATGGTVAVYPSPGAPSPLTSLSNPNSLGAPLVFLVTATQGSWMRVMLPLRPNGSQGWIRSDQVQLSSDPYKVDVSLSAHRLTVLDAGHAVLQVPVAVGKPGATTPTGQFYLTELLAPPDPSGAYGPYAYGTSDFSNTYYSFEGGPGQIGVHGTNEPWVIGHDASHGCIRLFDADITKVASLVPPGTPLDVTP